MPTVTFECDHCGEEHEYECDEEGEGAEPSMPRPPFPAKLKVSERSRYWRMPWIFSWQGREWVCDGHWILPRERVGEEPEGGFDRTLDANSDRVGKCIAVLEAAPSAKPTVAGRTGRSDVHWAAEYVRELAGEPPVYLREEYYAALADCDAWRVTKPQEPTFAYQAGVLQGVVMPLHISHTFDPDPESGVKGGAESAPTAEGKG